MTALLRLGVFLAITLIPARAADAPLQSASPDDQAAFAKIKDAVLKDADQPPMVLADSDEVYFWIMGDKLISLMDAYHYSHDPAFLDAYVPLQQNVLSQRYIDADKPEWDGWFAYKSNGDTPSGAPELDHESLVYYVPALMFVQEVRADPALKDKYGKQADDWLADVQRSIWAWDKRGCWHDFGDGTGWYSFPTEHPDPKTGQMIAVEAKDSGAVFPYNKVHQLDQAMTLAYRITGDDAYRQRMEKTAKFFKAHWRSDDKHVEWNYRDFTFPGDYVSGVMGQGPTKAGAFVHPHFSYYILDSNDIVWLYDVGIVYTKDDIDKLLQTNLQFMFMGDDNNPQYRMINGAYQAAGKYNKGSLWPALAHFSDKVRQLWKTQLDLHHDWTSHSALDYLIEKAQPISYDPRYPVTPNPAANGAAPSAVPQISTQNNAAGT
jgi:hypothetical protein